MSSTITALTSGGGLAMAGDTSGQLELKTNNGTTAVTVDTSQNVGIGSTTALAKLTALGSASTVANSVSTRNPIASVRGANDNNRLDFLVDNSGATSIMGLSAWNTAGAPTAMTFYTGTTGAEAMRITSTGDVGIGTTSVGWNGNLGVALRVGAGSIWSYSSNARICSNFYYNGSYVRINTAGAAMMAVEDGTINTYTAASGSAGGSVSLTAGPYVANLGTSWTSSSDERLKNVTGEITDALDKVSQLRAATYTWKSDESAKPQVGLIAQDLLKVLPEVVVVPTEELDSEGNQKYMGVNYTEVIPLLVASIKELNAKVDAQALEIQALKGVA